MTLNTFAPPLAHIPQTQKFQFEPEQKKHVVIRARRKKLNVFNFRSKATAGGVL